MDPGETVGLCRLTYAVDHSLLMCDVVQCTASTALDLLEVLLRVPTGTEVYFGVERYVRNLRGGGGKAGARTRDMVGSAITMAQSGRLSFVAQRSASAVKEWGTDARLKAAGILADTKVGAHARDAARHALYAAVADGKIPDPYSKKARRANG